MPWFSPRGRSFRRSTGTATRSWSLSRNLHPTRDQLHLAVVSHSLAVLCSGQSLSVPAGYLGENLPQGLQILGRAWDDAKIIGYAYAYEQATHHRRPPATVPGLR